MLACKWKRLTRPYISLGQHEAAEPESRVVEAHAPQSRLHLKTCNRRVFHVVFDCFNDYRWALVLSQRFNVDPTAIQRRISGWRTRRQPGAPQASSSRHTAEAGEGGPD
ncbi:hypothetical protein CKAH01_12020 [Colletotrichum kahawae]|uniref:Uncharacterized protein n=1 Tax=Colletotrichum kahawae TaxID=34407 RepID=A0AAD9YTP2_COLKA|nr:hypothetical protein CKAH01_12020 [Colletotrichum kahawae]